MENITEQFFMDIVALMAKYKTTQAENIKKAATVMAKSLKNDKLIHIFGTGGHSYMAGEEMFYRSGGLVPINPIFDGGVTVANGALRSTKIERTTGYAQAVLEPLKLEESGEVIIISNVYGVNSVTIDAALESKKKGLTVIAITSVEHAKQLSIDEAARHPSKKNLYEIADIVLDVPVPVGDAILKIEGLDVKIAPCSTILTSFCINSLVAETVRLLIDMGEEPPIWKSSNSPGGDEYNQKYLAKYSKRIKAL